jgi:hypothetical protein
MTHLIPHRIEFADSETIIIAFANKEERIAYLEFYSNGDLGITYKDNTGKFIGIETTYSEVESKLLEILNGNI